MINVCQHFDIQYYIQLCYGTGEAKELIKNGKVPLATAEIGIRGLFYTFNTYEGMLVATKDDTKFVYFLTKTFSCCYVCCFRLKNVVSTSS